MVQAGEIEEKTFGQKCGDGFRDFRQFLYNSETGEVMGRSGSSWAKIGLFYFVFYGFLAGFFVAMLSVFMTTVNQPGEGPPKLTQYIANKAGLVRLDRDNKLTSYNANDTDRIDAYSKVIADFLKGYESYGNSSGIQCGDKPCSFKVTDLGDCSGINDKSFGLKSRKPCIFLRINKVFGWTPNGENGFLKLTCEGATVLPTGFQLSAFPFEGQAGYVSPVVAVQIDTTNGEVKKADCYLEGKDIEVSDSYNPTRSYGKIRIEKISSTSD